MRGAKWERASGGMMCLLGMLLSTGATVAQGPDGSVRGNIESAWKAREKRLHSVKFSWVEKKLVPKGHVNERLPEPMREQALREMGIPKGAVVPPRDTTLTVNASITLDGAKMRYRRDDWEWSAAKSAYVPAPYLSVSDGKEARLFHPEGTPYTRFADGSIRAGRRNEDARNAFTSPVLALCRATSPDFLGWGLDSFEIAQARVKVGGRPCIELRRKRQSHELRLWIDSERDHVLVRRVDRMKDRVLLKIDVRYREMSGETRWVPEGWDLVVNRGDGKLSQSITATVNEVNLSHAATPDLFTVQFPPRTFVTDQKKKRDYIVKEGGEEREVRRDEMTLPFEQLYQTETGEPVGRPERRWLTTANAVLAAVGLTACGLLLYRRLRGRRVGPRPGQTLQEPT